MKQYAVSEDSAVIGVTFRDAQNYCRFRKARLPTEDEWEYIARGPERVFSLGAKCGPVATRRLTPSNERRWRCRPAAPGSVRVWRRCSMAPAHTAFAGRLLGASPDALEREAAADSPGSGGVFFLPYLSGERTPLDDPYARGVLFGMSETTSRADVTRAAMEGVALTLADARNCLSCGWRENRARPASLAAARRAPCGRA